VRDPARVRDLVAIGAAGILAGDPAAAMAAARLAGRERAAL